MGYMNHTKICSDLEFLPERMKIDRCQNLVNNLYSKERCIIQIKPLKQAMNHGLKLKKVHRVIKCNQEKGLKTYIDLNMEFRTKGKRDFKKNLFKLMNNSECKKAQRQLVATE